MSHAPTTQTMVRNDEQQQQVQIVHLTPEHFQAAHDVELSFVTHRKGCCFGLCPLSWCPEPQSEFDGVYQNHNERRETYAVAIVDEKVVGICKGRRHGQYMKWDESLLHRPKPGEFYVDTMAVLAEARGKGVGTLLLQWAEDTAITMGDAKMAIGVMKGNPAERLYKRFGFEETHRDSCCVGCLIGRPNGSYVGIYMEKVISKDEGDK